jgi:hypothetical protein
VLEGSGDDKGLPMNFRKVILVAVLGLVVVGGVRLNNSWEHASQ